MKVRDAIVKVLRDARRPLRVAEIADGIWAGGLCAISGITPERTVSSVLTTEIGKRGGSALFRRVRRGLYALRQTETAAASHKKPVRTATRYGKASTARQPSKADFSDPRLVPAFDPELYALLAELRNSFGGILGDVTDGNYFSHNFTRDQLRNAVQAIKALAPITPDLTHDHPVWVNFRRRNGLRPVGCEICPQRQVNDAHIVGRAFMKKAARQWRKFEKHPMNMMRLCPNHHAANHEPRKAHARDRRKLARLYKARARMTRLLRREAERELALMEVVDKRISRASDKVERAALKELARLTSWAKARCRDI